MLNILSIDMETIQKSLTIFLQGMLAIMIVITIIFLATLIMNLISHRLAEAKAAKELLTEQFSDDELNSDE